jgi:hypothetical protein
VFRTLASHQSQEVGRRPALFLRRLLRYPAAALTRRIDDRIAGSLAFMDKATVSRQFPDYYLTQLVLEHEARTPMVGARWDVSPVRLPPPAAMVFYHRDYLNERWGQELKVCSITPEAYGYQTALLLQK